MRDHYLTQEAYKHSLDKSKDIQHEVSIWRDAFLAIQQQRNMLDSAFQQGLIKQDDKSGVLHYWETQVRKLQGKYSDTITIDQSIFNKISLTGVDLVAIQPGVPYPVTIPNFPLLIASENLDYANHGKMFFNKVDNSKEYLNEKLINRNPKPTTER